MVRSLVTLACKLNVLNRKTTVTVFLDEQEMGTVTVKSVYMLTKVRKKLDAQMKDIMSKYRFKYADETLVSLENESNTRIESCMPSSSILRIYTTTKLQYERNDNFLVAISEDRLQNISSEAEAVVRYCVRIIEDFGNKTTSGIINSDMPNHIEVILQFTKDVARATADATGPSEEVHWAQVEKNLREIEKMMSACTKRPKVSKLWTFRQDQKSIKRIISSIQHELKGCSEIKQDHAVYFVRFKKMRPETVTLLDMITKTRIDALLQPMHDTLRKRIAAFLNLSDDDVKAQFSVLFPVNNMNRTLSKDNVSLVRRSTSVEVLVEKVILKDVLAPLFEQQSRLINREALLFNDDTFMWALEAFDGWIATRDSPHKAFMFAAPPGSGKTTFVSSLAVRRPDVIIGVHLCRHDDSRYRDPKIMLLSLSYQLTLQSPHYERQIRRLLIEKSLTRKRLLSNKRSVEMLFTEFFETPLAEIPIPDREKYCWIIDGLDEATHGASGENDILNTIRRHFPRLPSWLTVALTTRPRLCILKQLRKFNAKMIEPQTVRSNDDLQKYFLSILGTNCYGCIEDRVPLAHELASNAKGNFLYGSMIAEKIEMYCGIDDEKLTSYLSLPFEPLLQRELQQVREGDIELFWQIVKLSMVALKPLDCVVIMGLVNCTEEQLNGVLANAHSFFHVVQQRVRFLHMLVKTFLLQQLSDVAFVTRLPQTRRRRSCSGSSFKGIVSGTQEIISEEISKCHTYFANCVLGLLRENAVGDDQYHFNSEATKSYLLQYGIHHLALARMHDEARKMLLDPGFLLARATDASGIAECCELLSEGDYLLQLVGRAVSLSLDAIAYDPRQLIGQLVGRLMAASAPGHGDVDARQNVIDFIELLKKYDYGFQWWMPVAATWDQAEQAFQKRLVGHDAPVNGVAWHPEGRLCASASWDHTIRVFDTLTGNCIQTVAAHDAQVYAVHWDPLGTRFASGSHDCTIKIWNLETMKVESTLAGHSDAVFTVAFSKQNGELASGSKDTSIRVWNVASGHCTRTLHGHAGAVYSVSWQDSGDGTRLCSGGTDNTVRIWDVSTEMCLSILTGHRDWVRSCHWCGNGKDILSGSADNTVRVWDAESFSCEQVLMGHSQGVWSVAMSHDGRHAVSGSTDGTVRVWECNSGRCDQVLEGHNGNPVWNIAIAPDGKRVLSGSSDKTIALWDAAVSRSKHEINGHSKVIWSLDASKDGLTIVTCSSDKTARLWDKSTGQCERVFTGHQGPVWTVKLSHDERKIATGSTDNTAAIYRIRTGERRVLLVGHTDSIWDLVWSLDDKKIYTASRDTTIRRWDTTTGLCEFVYRGHEKEVKGLSLSYSGKYLASASTDASLRVWDLRSQDDSKVLKRKEAGALCVEWSPDGVRLASGYTSGCVRIWNVETGVREVGLLPGHRARTNSVIWSPSGTHVASASTDKEIRIWNVNLHTCEHIIKTATGMGIFGVKWVNNTIISAGADQTIRFFDASSGRCEAAMSRNTSLGIYDISWSRDGKSVASGSRDRKVQIWDADTGVCRKTLTGHTNWVVSVHWDIGGKRIMSKGDDDTTRIWDVDTGDCLEVVEGSTQLRDEFVIDLVEGYTVDLSTLTTQGRPVGVQCEKARIYGDRACGWAGQSVYFFKLMGKAPMEYQLGEEEEGGDVGLCY